MQIEIYWFQEEDIISSYSSYSFDKKLDFSLNLVWTLVCIDLGLDFNVFSIKLKV